MLLVKGLQLPGILPFQKSNETYHEKLFKARYLIVRYSFNGVLNIFLHGGNKLSKSGQNA